MLPVNICKQITGQCRKVRHYRLLPSRCLHTIHYTFSLLNLRCITSASKRAQLHNLKANASSGEYLRNIALNIAHESVLLFPMHILMGILVFDRVSSPDCEGVIMQRWLINCYAVFRYLGMTRNETCFRENLIADETEGLVAAMHLCLTGCFPTMCKLMHSKL